MSMTALSRGLMRMASNRVSDKAKTMEVNRGSAFMLAGSDISGDPLA
jgi:hypothetical protein